MGKSLKTSRRIINTKSKKIAGERAEETERKKEKEQRKTERGIYTEKNNKKEWKRRKMS